MSLVREALVWLRAQGDSQMDRRTFLNVTAGFSLSPMSGVFSASAQAAWPSHSMTIIVPFAPGGQADLAARPVALGLAKILGQSVVVDIARAPAAQLERRPWPRPTPMGTRC